MDREIQDIAIIEQLNSFKNAIVAGKIIVDGVEHRLPIYQTRIRENTLRIYLKVPSSTTGVLTRSALVDGLDREWVVKKHNYKKGTDGYIIVFPYRYTVQPFANEQERA